MNMNEDGKNPYLEKIAILEERVAYVEKINQQCLESLDIAGKIGYFQSSLNRLSSPEIILEHAKEKIASQITFEAMGFFLVDESSSEFFLAYCSPNSYKVCLEQERDFLIEKVIFPWVMREKRAILFPSRTENKNLVLHVMTTSSRIRGFFIGILRNGVEDVSYVNLKLLSVVLLFCANALESFELYSMIRSANISLREKIRGRTEELHYKSSFESLVKQISTVFLDDRKPICQRVQTSLGLLEKFISADQSQLFFEESPNSEFLNRALARCEISGIRKSITPFPKQRFEEIFADLEEREQTYISGNRLPSSKISHLLGVTSFESTVLIPIELKGDFRAVLFLGLSHEFDKWSDDTENMLKIAAEFFLNAMIREKMIYELEQQQEQLRYAQKMDAIGRLAGGISHDFNNILMSISVNAELALMHRNDNDPDENFRQILKATEKGSFITRQLLSLSKTKQPASMIVNPNKMIQELVSVLNRLIGDEIELTIQLPENDASISSGSGQLEQVIMNLVVNARDAIRENTDPNNKKEISLTSQIVVHDCFDLKIPPHIRFQVRDTGIGMSKEIQQHIFEPYFTTKPIGKGTGLGLSIVYQIIRQNGGTISIESLPGQGSCFTILWPLCDGRSMNQEKQGDVSFSGQERLLVVEDEPSILENTSRALENFGYLVWRAVNGREASEILESIPVDFVISDVNMPEMNGVELLKHIEKNHPKTQVILATGFFEDIDWEELEAKSIPLIEKPFSIMTLAKMIKKMKRSQIDGT